MKKQISVKMMEAVLKNKPKHKAKSGRKLDTLWKTKEGKVMTIDQMDDGHLLNSIRLLERKAVEVTGIRYTGDVQIEDDNGQRNITAADQAEALFPVYGEMVLELEARLEKKKTTPVFKQQPLGKINRKMVFED